MTLNLGRTAGTVLLISLLTLLLSSCAAIFNGTQQLVPFSSQPQGAEVWIDGELKGVTPVDVQLSRKSEHEVVLRYQGKEQTVIITNSTDVGMVTFDIIGGGVGGLAIWGAGAFSCGWTGREGCITGPLLIGVAIAATPIAIDAATGAWFRLEPGAVFVGFE